MINDRATYMISANHYEPLKVHDYQNIGLIWASIIIFFWLLSKV